jgi:hypothetical protein
MLGRLTRWLRALGIDAEFVEPGQQGQPHQQATLIQQVQEAALLQVGGWEHNLEGPWRGQHWWSGWK